MTALAQSRGSCPRCGQSVPLGPTGRLSRHERTTNRSIRCTGEGRRPSDDRNYTPVPTRLGLA